MGPGRGVHIALGHPPFCGVPPIHHPFIHPSTHLFIHPSTYHHRTSEPHGAWGWRHPWVLLATPPALAGLPRAGCPAPRPGAVRDAQGEAPSALYSLCQGSGTCPASAADGQRGAPGLQAMPSGPEQSPALSPCTSCRHLWPWWEPPEPPCSRLSSFILCLSLKPTGC